MRLARRLIRIASRLVPAEFRQEWVEEWEAELSWTGDSVRHAAGAFRDAMVLRAEGWTMQRLFRDTRGAVRSLVRRPMFTVLAGLTLAVGIGANTAIFSIVDSVLLDPLPFPESDRLVSYNHTAPGLGVPVVPHSPATYLHYSEHSRRVQALAIFTDANVNLLTDGEPRRLEASVVSQQFFDVLGVPPVLGRAFVPGEDRVGAEPVAVISQSVWEQSFGGDPAVVDRLVEMDGVRRRIVGVMPDRAALRDTDVWVPLSIDEADLDAGSFGMLGLARLASGASLEGAQAEMGELLLQFAAGHPDDLPQSVLEQAGLRADLKPLKELYTQNLRQTLWILLGTVGFVLLIACANVANLFLVRAESRQREQAVRTAMGASRSDVIRQYLAESVALSVGAGLLGLALASVGVKALLGLAPVDLPGILDIGIDGSVLAFTAVVSVVSGLLFGLFPAATYARPDLSSVIGEGGRSATAGKERHRARNGLVVAQVALALILLVGSGLMMRSFSAIQHIDLGFQPEGSLTFRVALPQANYPEATDVHDFYRRLQDQVAGIPGVEGVAMVSAVPLSETTSSGPMESEDSPVQDGELAPMVERRNATPGYFKTMGIRLLEGRELNWEDGSHGARSVIASAALAQTYWPENSALGRRIRSQGDEGEWWEVVGVVEDVRIKQVQEDPLTLLYFPTVAGTAVEPTPTYTMDVVVRTGGDPLARIPAAREAVRVTDPRLPIIQPRTVASVVDDSMASSSFAALLLGVAAAVALLLGTVGIYGVVSYTVSRRTKEIGVRLALGAEEGTVLGTVLREGMGLIGIGVGVGLLGAFTLSRALESLLYGVSATDPVTFAGTAALLTAVALLATLVPARRAARVDPVVALRSE